MTDKREKLLITHQNLVLCKHNGNEEIRLKEF